MNDETGSFAKDGYINFGERNSNNRLDGRGIAITSYEDMHIRKFKDGEDDAGNYITIYKDGHYSVGERYLDANGEIKGRGTKYRPDSTASFWRPNGFSAQAS